MLPGREIGREALGRGAGSVASSFFRLLRKQLGVSLAIRTAPARFLTAPSRLPALVRATVCVCVMIYICIYIYIYIYALTTNTVNLLNRPYHERCQPINLLNLLNLLYIYIHTYIHIYIVGSQPTIYIYIYIYIVG